MKNSQTPKIVAITPPAAIVDDAAFTTAIIDTKGFRHCDIIVHFGAMDIAMAALLVQESDASDMNPATTVSGTTGGTDFTLPIATDDNTFVKFSVDLRGKKRYLDLSATGGDGTAGTYMTAFAILSRPEEYPNSAAEQGFGLIVTA